jgi:hypothetical protein
MTTVEVLYEGKLLIHMENVEVSSFRKSWTGLGCNDEDLRRLQQELLENPDSGPVIPGTGSARKVRFGREGKGKSGDLRVIYVKFPAYESICLLFAYQKGDQENLSEVEKNVIRELIAEIESVLPLKPAVKPKAILQKMIGEPKIARIKTKATKPSQRTKDSKAKKEPKASASKAKTNTKKPKAKKMEKKK